MNNIHRLLLLALLSLCSARIFAQDVNVSGIVLNEKGDTLKGATVFIGSTERAMATDENGRFNFGHVPPGAFKISSQLIGYVPLTKNIVVKNIPVVIELKMQAKAINLAPVSVGDEGAHERNLNLFKEKFLGKSANGKACEILNPDIINFSTIKGHLFADADDFLLIENQRLGYRIHYLLQGFDYNYNSGTLVYHGECSFEELDGTENQKSKWTKNRLETYKGSFTHFLRSVYANNTVENGFITRSVYGFATFKYEGKTMSLADRLIVKDRQILFDTLVTAIDTNFVSFAFRQPLYVIYNPKHAARFKGDQSELPQTIIKDSKSSILVSNNPQAIVDQKGSYTDYHDFLIQGYWATARIGDQLPVEYKPALPDIPRRNIHTNSVLASLQKWTDSIPQEKAYLHMDKPYYAIGDTIWFKGYLTTGSRHQLSALSGALYVDLINDQSQLVKTLKLPADSGTVAGNLILGDEVKAGSYRLRAYTQWMRNAGRDYFFDHTFTVGDPKTFKDQKIPGLSSQQPDVQFFPESGDLINDITSRIAFKAVAADGLGTAISGKVVDDDNNQVAGLTTLHAGMGSFLFRPASGKTYTVNIKFSDGTTKDVNLPPALNDGYVLSVYQPGKDSILVRIQASATLQKSSIQLVVHSSGEIIFSSPVNFSSGMTSIWLDKKTFPSGIAQFTIFDSNHNPLNERVIFIKNNDQMQLAVKTPKASYQRKEHVQLELNAKESEGRPVAANFSVAVVDENKVPIDEDAESTIFSNILLTSDIKGYVEKPNYYFSADTDEVNKALDNLMLTQGYRRFEWKRLLTDTVNARPKFQADGLSTTISGTVTDLSHRKLPNATVLLVSLNAHINRVTTTDAGGRFKIDNLIFADSAKFAIQAKTKENSNHAIISLDSIPAVTVNINHNTAEALIIKTNLKKAEDEGLPINLTGLHVLKQVNIKSTLMQSRKDAVPQGMFSLPDDESADHMYTIPDPEHYINIKMFLQQRVAGMRVELNKSGQNTLVSTRPPDNLASNVSQSGSNLIGIFLNGVPAALDELIYSLNLEDVSKILVVDHNQAIMNFLRQGSSNSAGYLLILTKAPSMRKHYDPNIVNITPKGYNKVRQFYSPRYDKPIDVRKISDQRTTIYWNPYVNTDTNGTTTLDFFNADGPGNYRITVEGINAAGELGRQVYHYKVE